MPRATAPLQLIEERTFSAKLGDRTITGLAVASAWEGLTKYTTSNGAHLIVFDAEQRVITGTPSLLSLLGASSEPKIGELFEGGMYAGKTTVDGKDANLILLPGEATDIDWVKAGAWAKEQSGHLPTRAEQRILYENLKSEFAPAWYWSCEQHASYSDYAWGQYFDGGGQGSNLKSCSGRARAVRRLIIQ